MSQNRRQILQMLAENKINADEADRLLSALEREPVSASAGPAIGGPSSTVTPRRMKYLRVTVDSDHHRGGPTKVNIRVPMPLLRAGVRLSSLIPPEAREEVNAALRRKGVTFDLSQLKPENLEALIEQLGELTVDLDQEGTRVRVFAE